LRDFTKPLRVTDDVYWVGVNDRRKVRFENMRPWGAGEDEGARLIDG